MNRSLSARINARASARNVPLSAVFEVTYRCNQSCAYCFQSGLPRTAELETAQVRSVLQQLAQQGALYLALTGGEPLLRNDLLDIASEARALGFAVSIITNGSLIDEKKALRIRELGVLDIGVSLLASNRDLHDRIAGVDGRFDAAMAALNTLAAAGTRVIVKHTVTRDNFGEYRALSRLADKRGWLFECDTMVAPAIRGTVSPSALTLEQHRIFHAEMGIDPQAQRCRLASDVEAKLHCDAGRSVCGITPSGELVPCILLPISFGNLAVQPFDQVWHGAAARRFREEEQTLDARCGACVSRDLCSRCHAIAFAESADWRGPSPTLCLRTASLTSY